MVEVAATSQQVVVFFGGKGGGPPPSSEDQGSRTLGITGAITASRLWMKKEMEKFGRVEVCHMGNRQNPALDPPWVRFEKAAGAEAALQAIKAGMVFLDGKPIVAELKKDHKPRGPPPRRALGEFNKTERELEFTSRDLAQESRGSRRRDSRDRSRDRDRDRRRR